MSLLKRMKREEGTKKGADSKLPFKMNLLGERTSQTWKAMI